MLPEYIVYNDPNCLNKEILKTPAKEFMFPLSKEDEDLIDTLVEKFDQEENCLGLAASQIGIGKQVIIFKVLNDPRLKKWRPDLEEGMPKTIWLNPSYEPLTEDFHEDYEGCFSVSQVAGLIKRYKEIKYRAYDRTGALIEGIATGFLARVIQHEIDHTHGKLCIDFEDPQKLLSIEEYKRRRNAAMAITE